MGPKRKQSVARNAFNLEKQARSPYYSIRVMVNGERRRFSTGETSRAAANRKAIAIIADIRSQGFGEAIHLHAKRNSNPKVENPTIEKFADIFRNHVEEASDGPSRYSAEGYIKKLNMICRGIRAKRVDELSPEKIERFLGDYIKRSVNAGRDPESVRTTANAIARNAAAMFSQAAMRFYSRHGVSVTNPFDQIKVKRGKIESYTPLDREVVTKIWNALPNLLQGNIHADDPDFQVPQVGPYTLFLLELCLGLRRNEADKAEWAWLTKTHTGDWILSVDRTDIFTPKGRTRRLIPVSSDLISRLDSVRSDPRFIVPAPSKRPCRVLYPRNLRYRCDRHHRVLVKWLRLHGVRAGKPCQTLRKEFGSQLATNAGIFQAQRLLGHSSPNVTSTYYAGLTELPPIQPIPSTHGYEENET